MALVPFQVDFGKSTSCLHLRKISRNFHVLSGVVFIKFDAWRSLDHALQRCASRLLL